MVKFSNIKTESIELGGQMGTISAADGVITLSDIVSMNSGVRIAITTSATSNFSIAPTHSCVYLTANTVTTTLPSTSTCEGHVFRLFYNASAPVLLTVTAAPGDTFETGQDSLGLTYNTSLNLLALPNKWLLI